MTWQRDGDGHRDEDGLPSHRRWCEARRRTASIAAASSEWRALVDDEVTSAGPNEVDVLTLHDALERLAALELGDFLLGTKSFRRHSR